MGQTSQNIDQTSGDWAWRQTPGLRNPNPVPTDAPTQSCLAPVPPLAVAFNKAAQAPLPVSTTKKLDGSTATANGQISGTTCVINNPA
jgi:hypothetical protein